jgi:molybdopterin converting factor small subunit
MTVRVLLFASYADLTGRKSVDIPVPPGATVEDVLVHLRAAVPGADRLPPRPLVAVNCIHAGTETRVSDGDELAILPPMAGG